MTRYQLRKRHAASGFGAVGVAMLLVVVAVVAFGAWYVLQANDTPAGTSQDTPAAETDKAAVRPVETKSGKGGFSIIFPDGWNNIRRDKESDRFVISGTDQPEFKAGQRAMVTDVAGYGSDSAIVFSAMIHNNFAAPQGEATDFVFGKGDDLVSGKKYVYEFEQDELEGIGYQRIKGDRNYTYVFPLGGSDGKRELRVTYSVYASDPRNNIEKIDEVVRTIRVLK